jgi:hypothetical protein
MPTLEDPVTLREVLVGPVRGDAVELTYEGETEWFPLSLIDSSPTDLARLDFDFADLDVERWKAAQLGWLD